MVFNCLPIVTLTDHVLERAKERLNWCKEETMYFAQLAYRDGLTLSEIIPSGLKTYLFNRIKGGGFRVLNVRVYGNIAFLFDTNKHLVTIYTLGSEFSGDIKRSWKAIRIERKEYDINKRKKEKTFKRSS